MLFWLGGRGACAERSLQGPQFVRRHLSSTYQRSLSCIFDGWIYVIGYLRWWFYHPYVRMRGNGLSDVLWLVNGTLKGAKQIHPINYFICSFILSCLGCSFSHHPPPPPLHTHQWLTQQPSSSPPRAITFHLPLFPLSRSPKWVRSVRGGCLGSVNYAHLSWRSTGELDLRTPRGVGPPRPPANHPCWLGPHGPNQNYKILCVQLLTVA